MRKSKTQESEASTPRMKSETEKQKMKNIKRKPNGSNPIFDKNQEKNRCPPRKSGDDLWHYAGSEVQMMNEEAGFCMIKTSEVVKCENFSKWEASFDKSMGGERDFHFKVNSRVCSHCKAEDLCLDTHLLKNVQYVVWYCDGTERFTPVLPKKPIARAHR